MNATLATLMVARDAGLVGDEATRASLLNELADVHHVRRNYRVPGSVRKLWRRIARNGQFPRDYTDEGFMDWKIKRPDEVEIARIAKGGQVFHGEEVSKYANEWRVRMREMRKVQGGAYTAWWDEL